MWTPCRTCSITRTTIMRTRAFVRYFRRTYAPEEIRNQLEQADALRYAQADQQASFLPGQGEAVLHIRADL